MSLHDLVKKLDSGDAIKDKQEPTRKKLNEKLHVVGVNGTTKEVAHEYTMKVPSAVKGKHIELTKSIDTWGLEITGNFVGKCVKMTKIPAYIGTLGPKQ